MAKNAIIKWIKASNKKVIQSTESFFYWWGCLVATHPIKVILVTSMFTALGALGLVNLQVESDGWKFWLPEGTRYSFVQEWKEGHFVEGTRATITFLTHDESVLTREGLLLLFDLHEKARLPDGDSQILRS